MSQDSYQDGVDILWQLAVQICDVSAAWNPDLTLVLMRSGIGPMIAAETLQDYAHNTSFKNVVYTNLGREKFKDYDRIPSPRLSSKFMGYYEHSIAISHFLAWLSRQDQWFSVLRHQIEKVVGTQPIKKILVGDDFYYEGATSILVSGLLEKLYPACKIHFLSNPFYRDWKHIKERWIQSSLNEFWGEIEDKEKQEIKHALFKIAPGTEDIHPNRLDWQSLKADSALLEPLLPYGPSDLWLSFPEWVKHEVRRVIREKQSEYDPENVDSPRSFGARPLSLEFQFLRDIWLHDSISIKDCMGKYKITYSQAYREVCRLRDSLTLTKINLGKSTRYSFNVQTIIRYYRVNITRIAAFMNLTDWVK